MLGFGPLGFLPLGFITIASTITIGGSLVIKAQDSGLEIEIRGAGISANEVGGISLTPSGGGLVVTAPSTRMIVRNA